MKTTRLIPISYCFGVTNALKVVYKLKKEKNDRTIVLFGDLVHNKNVIDSLNALGIKSIRFTKEDGLEKLSSVNDDDIVIFSAHGHNPIYEDYLKSRNIEFYDTTCVKVKNILKLIHNSKDEIIYIGKSGHPECEASLSYSKNIHLYDVKSDFDFSVLKTDHPLVITQSTLSILEVKDIFDNIKSHVKAPNFIDEVCNASRVRQEQILSLDHTKYDLVVVVGDPKSSNTTKLFDLAKRNDKLTSIMVNTLDEIKALDLTKFKSAIITSGTSTPLDVIEKIETYLKEI